MSPADEREYQIGVELAPLAALKNAPAVTVHDSSFGNMSPSSYNALLCLQNALSGDIAVQRLYIGSKNYRNADGLRPQTIEFRSPTVGESFVNMDAALGLSISQSIK